MASINNFFVRLFLRVVVKKNKLHVVSIRAVRESLNKLTKLSKLSPNIEYKAVVCDGVPAEWTISKNTTTEGLVIYFHGGGYVSGSIKTHRGLVGGLAKNSRTKCLSVDYRLAPENPFPAAVEDAITVYKWVLAQGVNNKKVVLAGDSAGGGLTLATLLKIRDLGLPLPAAGVMLSPWLDLECTDPLQPVLEKSDPMVPVAALRAYGIHYAKHDIKNPYASPINADFKGLPDIFIQVSNNETLTQDTMRFEQKAKAQGVQVEVEVWNNMVHVWQAYGPVLPEAMRAVKKLGNYIFDKVK